MRCYKMQRQRFLCLGKKRGKTYIKSTSFLTITIVFIPNYILHFVCDGKLKKKVNDAWSRVIAASYILMLLPHILLIQMCQQRTSLLSRDLSLYRIFPFLRSRLPTNKAWHRQFVVGFWCETSQSIRALFFNSIRSTERSDRFRLILRHPESRNTERALEIKKKEKKVR